MTFSTKERLLAAFHFYFRVPARTILRVRLEVVGLMGVKFGLLTCSPAADGDDTNGWLVEFVAIGVLDLELVPVWKLDEGIDMASK